jgi:hypothetical protein
MPRLTEIHRKHSGSARVLDAFTNLYGVCKHACDTIEPHDQIAGCVKGSNVDLRGVNSQN